MASSDDKPLYVTRPYLPPLADFIPHLEKIWDNRILTNSGPFHQRFEQAIQDFLGVEHVSLMTNGTLALMVALRALNKRGLVITTPYSFVATSHAMLWNGLTPRFVDICPDTFNLDPARIEEAITPDVCAIMPVHCYGIPCDVAAIAEIAARHGLPVIYDAAHAFGVADEGGSLLRHGDMSVLSFHATKVFNTFEGGAVICRDIETKKQLDLLKNFGFTGEDSVTSLGINSKMDEMRAALGLLQLDHFTEAVAQRRQVDDLYRQELEGIVGIRVPPLTSVVTHNYAYFPILVEPDYPLSRNQLHARMRSQGIYTRRYFYPLISTGQVYQEIAAQEFSSLPIATSVTQKVLCLPIYPDMDERDVERVVRLIATALGSQKK
jgi:dTDP-4-amino-4,6-dideoxygalactose transaminase